MKSLSSSSSSARNPIAHLVAIRNRIILPPISNPCPSAVTRQEKAILLFNISRQNKFKSVTCVIVCSSLSLLVNIEIRYTEASNPLEIPINEYSTIQYTSCHILRDTLHFQPYVRVCDTNDTDGSFPVLHVFRPPPPQIYPSIDDERHHLACHSIYATSGYGASMQRTLMRRSESCGILTTSSDSQFRENHIIFINKIIVIAARMISFIWSSLTVGGGCVRRYADLFICDCYSPTRPNI